MGNAFQSQDAPDTAFYVRVPCIVFFIVTPIFVFIRLYNRIARKTGIGLDDITIVFSFICTLIVQILMMISCNYGFGQHVKKLSPDNLHMALKLFYVAQIFYKLTINLTKISILLLYLRIFVQRWFRISSTILIGVVSAFMVATVCASIWQCSPIAGAWDKSIKPMHCGVNLTVNWYANAGFAIATDLMILILPMQPIWTSKLPVNQKRALMLVFALGGFATFTSVARATTLNFSTTTPDITYDIASTLWTMVEENIAIICACLPMCRMVLAWIFPRLFANHPVSADKNDSESTGPTITIGQRRTRSKGGQWQPYTGPATSEGINRSIIQHPDASQEHILGYPGSPKVDNDNSIIKTTQYEVSYEMQTKKSFSTNDSAV